MYNYNEIKKINKNKNIQRVRQDAAHAASAACAMQYAYVHLPHLQTTDLLAPKLKQTFLYLLTLLVT